MNENLAFPLYGATFGQAVSRFFKKYATFTGRASRSEFWWVYLFFIVVGAVYGILFAITGGDMANGGGMSGFGTFLTVLMGIFGLATIIPHIALSVRRLHDANYSGWLYLLVFIPGVGAVILFVFMLLPSNPQGAQYDV